MKRLVLLGLIVGLVGLAFSAEYTFYVVSHGGPGDPFWGVVMKGMQDAAEMITKGTGDTIKATYLGPAIYSVTELVNMLNSAIAARPNGIVCTITDPAALDEPLRRAIGLGIPVIAINVPDPRPAGERIPYLFYVGGDEYLSGIKAAEKMLAVRKPIRAVVFIHEVGHVGLELRAKGFIEVMSQAGVPAEKLAIGTDPTQAVDIIRGYFAKHPETDAIFTLGPLGTLPTVTFLKEQGLAGKVMLGCFDLDEVTLKAIKEGIAMFTVTQQQYLQGYLPIVWLYLYNKYGFLPASDILTGPGFVDSSNVKMVEELIVKGYW
ncbi:MAG: sugar ABC transporter substrate-binding protein [Candidatus Bipolaricaulaceae bacterium]